eukprot:4719894-Pleurochrysis_carterae.AAC.2
MAQERAASLSQHCCARGSRRQVGPRAYRLSSQHTCQSYQTAPAQLSPAPPGQGAEAALACPCELRRQRTTSSSV